MAECCLKFVARHWQKIKHKTLTPRLQWPLQGRRHLLLDLALRMLAIVMNPIFFDNGEHWNPHKRSNCLSNVRSCLTLYRGRAVRHLEKGRVGIFAAGTGNPFFTRDTAAALCCAKKCCEVNAEVVFKATMLMDPRCNPDARLQETLTYHDVTSKELSVLDMTAITL
ncbi:hypothetical protein HAX54_031780 [Datura stramonium]|uniref:Uncharacterized protein n=1 Tax=Datura stramonium TaxID=4076 RepID=A0ABS8VAZ1_DATST|nr:hypothetical protein [Datura stramonium]